MKKVVTKEINTDFEIKQVCLSAKISCELKDGLWNTFEYGLTVDIKNPENIEKINEDLWEKCLVQVENQIEESTKIFK